MTHVRDPRLAQAATLLAEVLTQQRPFPCTLAQLEDQAHALSQELGRQAVEQCAQQAVAHAEAVHTHCPCGARLHAQQRRSRTLLLVLGLVHLCFRRYQCPACRRWSCPGAATLQVRERQRLSRRAEEAVCAFGLSWSYAAAVYWLDRVLPGLSVSAKTVERCTKRCAAAVQAREDAQATALLAPEGTETRSASDYPAGRPFVHPSRIYVGLDGVLVRGRKAKEWLEVQVGSLWSAWRDLPHRKTPRRELLDVTVVARAGGWEKLGAQVWRQFVLRGGVREPAPEVVVFGDGATGIRSLWERHFAGCRAILDLWHVWEKVKTRAREVFRDRKRALGAAQVLYARVKRGALEEAEALLELWPVASEWARERREKLRAYLTRHQDVLGNYEALREQGYLIGSGRTEKANELVVVPRMKDGKMHWSRSGANAVALLRAQVLNDPAAPLLPT